MIKMKKFMILKEKINFSSDRFHSINKTIAFCNQIRDKYTLRIYNKKFPFLHLLKFKPSYYIFKNIINLSLKMQVYNIESKHQIGIHNPQVIYRRLPVLLLAHSGTNLIVNKMQEDIFIKKFLSRMSLKSFDFIEKNISKIQQNVFLYKKIKHIKSKDEFEEIKFPSIYNVQAVSKYNRVSIATLPFFSNTDLSINKILLSQLQANISTPYLSGINHKLTSIKSELMNKFRRTKTEFIFLNPNKQLEKIRDTIQDTIQKQINREQPKEEVISVILKKDRNVLKSKDFQNLVDQIYKLILKRWQKDLERRGIFHA